MRAPKNSYISSIAWVSRIQQWRVPQFSKPVTLSKIAYRVGCCELLFVVMLLSLSIKLDSRSDSIGTRTDIHCVWLSVFGRIIRIRLSGLNPTLIAVFSRALSGFHVTLHHSCLILVSFSWVLLYASDTQMAFGILSLY